MTPLDFHKTLFLMISIQTKTFRSNFRQISDWLLLTEFTYLESTTTIKTSCSDWITRQQYKSRATE